LSATPAGFISLDVTMDHGKSGKVILGLPAHMKAAAASIAGPPHILVQRHDRLLFGIFEVLLPA
jgi:hypothetical protein